MKNKFMKLWLAIIISVLLLGGTTFAWFTIVNTEAQTFDVIINKADARNITIQTYKGYDYDNNGVLDSTTDAVTFDPLTSTKGNFIQKYYHADLVPLSSAPTIRNIYSDSKVTFKMIINNGGQHALLIDNYLGFSNLSNKYIAIMFSIKINSVSIYDTLATPYLNILNSETGTPTPDFNMTIPMIDLIESENYLTGLELGASKTAEIDFQIVANQTSQMETLYSEYIGKQLEVYWDKAEVSDIDRADLKTTLQACATFADVETAINTFLASNTDEHVSGLLNYVSANKVRIDANKVSIREAMLQIADIGQGNDIVFTISNIYVVINKQN